MKIQKGGGMSISYLVPWNWDKKNVPVKKDSAVDPFTELQHRMNSLFDDFWDNFNLMLRRFSEMRSARDFAPDIDIKDKGKEISVRSEIPGMNEKDNA